MRSITSALLGLAIALPVGIATVPAHADSNWLGQAQDFLQGNHQERYNNRDERDRSDAARHDYDHTYGYNRDEGDRDNRGGDRQYGYNNGHDHHWNNHDGDNARRFNNDNRGDDDYRGDNGWRHPGD